MSIDDIVKSIVEDEPERHDWSIIRTPEHAKAYYDVNYPGLSRNQVKHQALHFYQFLIRKGWHDIVLPSTFRKKLSDYSSIRTVDDAKRYFELNFSGLTRSVVRSRRPGFCTFLESHGWMELVLPSLASNHKDYSGITTLEDALVYFKANFEGWSRSELQKKAGGFHGFLTRKGWYEMVVTPSKKEKHEFWKLETLDNVKEYYEQHFVGLSCEELKANKAGSAFYDHVIEKGWLAEIFPFAKKGPWSSMKTADDAKQYYDEHFADMSRSEILSCGIRKSISFISMLKEKCWLDEVVPSNLLDWSELKTPEDAKRHYESHYVGMTGHALRYSEDVEARRFLAFLNNKDWIKQVIPKKNKDWSWMRTPEDAKRFYEDNYAGMSRGEVKHDRQGAVFYINVRQSGWLDIVFPPKERNDYSGLNTPQDAKGYFDRNYKGFTRKRLVKEASGFYSFLVSKGWQDAIYPTQRQEIDWSMIKSVEDAIEYYNKNYDGMNRTQVSKDKEKNGSKFYDFLRNRRWVHILPRVNNDYSRIKTLEDARRMYESSFAGVGRSELLDKNGKFYHLLKEKGWIDALIPDRRGKYERR